MHKALYRVYRPKNFNDIVGQEHIVRTLKNQIESQNVGHAYLFCGTRGTGKTSTAKIFSRAVNCTDLHDNEPCNECESCREILEDKIQYTIMIDFDEADFDQLVENGLLNSGEVESQYISLKKTKEAYQNNGYACENQ